jgi:predicted dehydrogenase
LSEEDSKQFIEFVNYYIHQVNLMRHLLGEDYTVSYADPKGLVLAGHSASGVPCVLEMATYYTTIGWQESALVTFDRGWIRLELPAPMVRHRPGRVTIFKDPGDGAQPQEVTPDLPWVDAMQQQALHFVKEIRGEETCLCRAEEALKDLEVARAYVDMLNKARGS